MRLSESLLNEISRFMYIIPLEYHYNKHISCVQNPHVCVCVCRRFFLSALNVYVLFLSFLFPTHISRRRDTRLAAIHDNIAIHKWNTHTHKPNKHTYLSCLTTHNSFYSSLSLSPSLSQQTSSRFDSVRSVHSVLIKWPKHSHFPRSHLMSRSSFCLL